MSLRRTGSMLFLAVALFGSAVWNQDSHARWEWDLTPLYVWAMGIDGDVAVGGQFAPVDVSFSDLLDELDFAGTVHLEGRNARWGFLFDLGFYALSPEAGLPPVGAFPGGKFGVDMDMTMVEAAAYRRFGEVGGKSHYDVLFGARYTELDSTVKPPAPLPQRSATRDWTDAMVGGRLSIEVTDKWSLSMRGDVSAGGSDLTWNVTTMFLREWSKVGLVVGYRILDVDYEDGAGADLFLMDVQMPGPLVGVNIHWD